jgi:hypothetical protein
MNNQSTINQYFSYDSTSPCLMNLSTLINLPNSSFNSSFPPPVVATSLGVQINSGQANSGQANSGQTGSSSSNTAVRIAAVHLFVWNANIFDRLQCETFRILLPCWMLFCAIYI